MKVLVAGGTGLIGRATVQSLTEAGHQVVVVARHPRDLDAGASFVSHDLGIAPLPRGTLDGCDAIVNLVGVSMPRGLNTFERAHVEAVEHLIASARAAGVQRFVHVSVVDISGARGAYMKTKQAGERLVVDSDLRSTVIRPALVYGPGDDMTTQLVRLIRLAPVFAVPGGHTGPLAAVDVRDVASAIRRSLERPQSIGEIIDVVGPERLTLRELVARVAGALELPTRCLPLPPAVMRHAASVAELLGPSAPITRAQVDMLIAGLAGDPGPARTLLELEPRHLSKERIQELASSVDGPPLRLRWLVSAEHRAWLRGLANAWPSWRWFAPLALVLLLVAGRLVEDIWVRMLGAELALAALALGAVPLPWRELLRPRWRHVAWGLSVAGVMFVGGQAVLHGLLAFTPDWTRASADVVFGWSHLHRPWLIALMLPVVTVTEDLVWRGAVTLPATARWGPAVGTMVASLGFAIAHVTSGPPLLWIAAVLAGGAWSIIVVRTRSLVPVAIAHASWDAAMVLTGL